MRRAKRTGCRISPLKLSPPSFISHMLLSPHFSAPFIVNLLSELFMHTCISFIISWTYSCQSASIFTHWDVLGQSVLMIIVWIPSQWSFSVLIFLLPLASSGWWACPLWKHLLHLASRTLNASRFLSPLRTVLSLPTPLFMLVPASRCPQPHFFFCTHFLGRIFSIFFLRGPLYDLKIIEEARELLFVSCRCCYLYTGN